ncbi:MAG: imidazole glycerol phosphate synthase subunit HisH [Candidatus Eremiobacteraeota bacterium]|nr:imidazole glycerol phosphate synthase subunit HisH [Candidatus Eremiobacteraeota bacterium]
MLAVIDYGGGNLGSLIGALERRKAHFEVTADPKHIAAADAAIFPGDGAFAATMQALQHRGLDRAIEQIIAVGRPFLGICVGMQILYAGSEEFSDAPGLGIFKERIRRFTDAPRVPHMGWNRLELLGGHPFIEGLGPEPYAYFLHSYRAPVGEETVAAATHGERFSAVVARGNVMGTQFHPEKSQATGARLLDNFLRLATGDDNRKCS